MKKELNNYVLVDVSYELWTPEDLEQGEPSESGFADQDLAFRSREAAIAYLEGQFGLFDGDGSDLYSCDPEIDYVSGATTRYGLHITSYEELTNQLNHQLVALRAVLSQPSVERDRKDIVDICKRVNWISRNMSLIEKESEEENK